MSRKPPSSRRAGVCALAALMAVSGSSALAEDGSAPPLPRVRATDSRLRGMVDDAIARSATFRGLVDTLQASDVIVYIVPQMPDRDRYAGELHFAIRKGGERYLRVNVQRDMNPAQLTAIIAHELQHAIEVAETPSVVDTDSLRAMYEERGFEVATQTYETEAAQAIARRVLREITAPTRTAEPPKPKP